MENNKIVKSIVVLLVLALAGTSFAVGYQPVPEANDPRLIASGLADATGSGGTAFVEYWVWDGANGYYFYTYQIINPAEDPCFTPYIKHLEIGNPSGEEYLVTGSSGGGPTGGTAWTPSVWQSGAEGTLVTWTASDTGTVVYPGQTSWEEPKFQFASQLPPSIAHIKVRQGGPNIEADGLIPAPSTPVASIIPRSAGYWKYQFIGKGSKNETIFNLMNYMNEIEGLSNVFDDDLSGSGSDDFANGSVILDVSDSSDMRTKAKKQLFALWLNIASGKLSHFGDLTFVNPNGQIVTVSATEVATEVETILNNTSATAEQLEYAKDLAEILNLL